MTKGEKRKLRKAGKLKDFGTEPIPYNDLLIGPLKRTRSRKASCEEQYGRYLDCGPGNWDDRDNPDY